MSGLAGRNHETRAIVTGGAQGIGFAVAEALADEGCRALALIGRSQEKGDKAVAVLKKNGVDAIFISADVAKVADCKRAIAAAIAHFGTLNALVNAAATSARGSLVETSEELFDQIFDTNVRGPFFLMQGLVAHLLERKAPGSIVNVLSMSAHAGQSFLTPYSTSKGALMTLTKNVASAYRRNRIRCNAVLPGWMDTEGEDIVQKKWHDAPDDWLEKAEAAQPMGQLVKPAQLARLITYMVSPQSGRSQKVKTEISVAMQQASEELDFERAAIYRDRLAALSHVQAHQGINPQTVEEADVFAIHQEGGQTGIQVFFFRTGQNWGNRAYFPKADPALEPAEVLGSFLAQFYDDKLPARTLLLSQTVQDQELLAEALSTRAGRKVAISVPQRGEKKDLTDHALQNAREALGRRLAETSTQARLLQGFAETFGLEKPPARIEVYDNSHIMGTNAVGAMVVAGAEGFVKNQYRKFNIRSTEITPGDDFGMMREVMQRRFSRLLREHGDAQPGADAEDEGGDDLVGGNGGFPAWPDVILIDGGQGQMTAVRQILSDLGVEDRVVAIGIAKGPDRDAGRERFFVKGRDSFMLPVRDPVLYFVQRLRDEVHRFAIGSHRARRKKEMVKSPLDEIAGIGPGRKRALLLAFGTAKAVSRAAVEDLVKVDGISEHVAKLVYNHFHES